LQRWAGTPLKERKTLLLDRVLDGMDGKLTNASLGQHRTVFGRYNAARQQ
jgi:hypothetical protein